MLYVAECASFYPSNMVRVAEDNERHIGLVKNE